MFRRSVANYVGDVGARILRVSQRIRRTMTNSGARSGGVLVGVGKWHFWRLSGVVDRRRVANYVGAVVARSFC